MYKNDKKDGEWIYYYHVQDKKKSEGRYVAGNKVGQWLNFFENEFGDSTVTITDGDGKKHKVKNLSSQVHYEDGVLHGSYVEWDETGKEISTSEIWEIFHTSFVMPKPGNCFKNYSLKTSNTTEETDHIKAEIEINGGQHV